MALVFCLGMTQDDAEPPPLAPLSGLSAELNPAQVDLGRMLFFDNRLSGDDTINCATCHNPERGWGDGMPLSVGYPGSLYFRNTPTVVNVGHSRYLYWDGRLPGSDMQTLVRDHIAEAHFFQADGRLLIERMRQVPTYETMFQDAFDSEPTYGGILKSLAAFVSSLESTYVPLDRFLQGDQSALSDGAKRGLELFQGKAGCIQCHNGPMLSDNSFHNLGLESNQNIFKQPQRHITFRRFFRTLGLDSELYGSDPGLYAITKQDEDYGKFRTPTLREVSRTAPYMHDGTIRTLAEVVEMYDSGGGPGVDKDPLLKPLGLIDQEKADIVEFLESLSGEPVTVEMPERPDYELRKLGEN